MIKKISSSLTAKIFLATGLLLALACLLTYFFIAWFMPVSYTTELNRDLDRRAKEVVLKLGRTDLQGSTNILNDFVIKTGVEVRVIDPKGERVDLPLLIPTRTVYDGVFFGVSVSGSRNGKEEPGKDLGFDMSVDKTYTFMLAGSNEPYKMVVISSGPQVVNQALDALKQTLPWLLVTILCISLLGSLFYSRYVTRPIVKMSAISRKMSDLDFDWHCDDSRSDELGQLARSLNELSGRLSQALAGLRQANLELKGDIDRERELEQRRLDFFSAVSHELKTPITVIKGQLEGMLGRVGVYQDRDKYLARALEVTGRMEELVQGIMNVSRLESPEAAFSPEPFDLAELVRGRLDGHVEQLERKSLKVALDIEEDLPVVGDPVLLGRALDNLISNAWQYTPEGRTVRVTAGRVADGVRFSIENTGAHIPEAELPRLFEAFYRVDPSRSRRTGGSGLGLYIVKTILERHGASFRMENTVDGVKFTFVLTASPSC